MVWTAVVHTAYTCVSAEIVKVSCAASDIALHVVPAVGGVVHQPEKVKPVLTRDPVLPRTVTVAFVL
jgi:hypothetical protein